MEKRKEEEVYLVTENLKLSGQDVYCYSERNAGYSPGRTGVRVEACRLSREKSNKNAIVNPWLSEMLVEGALSSGTPLPGFLVSGSLFLLIETIRCHVPGCICRLFLKNSSLLNTDNQKSHSTENTDLPKGGIFLIQPEKLIFQDSMTCTNP